MLSHSDLIINVLDVIRFHRGVVSYSTSKRPFHVLSRRIRGNSEIYKDNRTYYADESKVLYIPSGTDYSQKSGCEEEIIAVHFEILNFGTNRIQAADFPDSSITEDFSRLHELWSAKRPGYRYLCNAAFYEILANLCSSSENNSGKDMILASLEYIDKNFEKKITIPYLAKLCGVSESYYRRIFSKCMGISPLKYINRRRVAYAKPLILSGRYSMSEVSAMCGFSEQKYMYDVFKRETGLSPSEYRKMGLG